MKPASEQISRNTRLKCAPSLTISVAGDDVTLQPQGAGVFKGTLRLLEILSVFSTPRTLEQGLSELAAGRSRLDWVETSAALVSLVNARVLVQENLRAGSVGARSHGFDQAGIHIAMLNDRDRTDTYLNALRREVKPGDVVVDLGTGTGILAATAAKCGARRVYAIEATGIASVARSLFAANGVDDVVTLVEGRSTRIELPEKADLIVSEIIGSEPLGERALEYTRDALARFAKPGARLLPKRLRILAQALELPAEEFSQHVFSSPMTAQWRDWYGLDFDPLLEAKSPVPYRFWTEPKQVKPWTCLSEAEPLIEVDFEKLTEDTLEVRRRFEATRSGVVNAFGVYFDLEVTEGHVISTRPSVASAASSWQVTIWLVDPAFPVGAGSNFELSYRHTPTATTLECVRA